MNTAPIELPARWHGDPPRAGDYLKSPGRARVAYRVLEARRKDPRRNRMRYGYVFTVVRVAVDAIPKNARVCDWYWDPR
jgi:hypothetical protein